MLKDKDTRELVTIISDVFELGKSSEVTRLSGGILNEVYRLETSCGQYVMRVNHVRRSKTAFEHLSALLSHLEERGLTVDELVRTSQGHLVVWNRGLLISVHKYIPGVVYHSPLDLTSSQLANMMAFLALYHSAVDGYALSHELTASSEVLPIVYTEDLDQLKVRFQRLAVPSGDLEAAFGRSLDRLRVVWSTESHRKIKRIATHGDFRSCNIVFDGKDAYGLFDWDLLSYSPRLLDVVVAANGLSKVIVGSLSNNPSEWLEHFAKQFAAYATAAERLNIGITELEFEAIPHMLIVDTILSGMLFALSLNKLPLKPGETIVERKQWSTGLLEESINDLLALDELAAKESALSSIVHSCRGR